jgi:PAS domain S-box-containing protein
VRGIEHRTQAEETLAACEEQFRQIVALADEAFISVDEDQRIVLFSEGAERIFGWRGEEVLGQPLDRLLPERMRALHRSQIRAFGKSGERTRGMGQRRPVRALRQSGEEFPAEASICSSVLGGRRIYSVVLRDTSHATRLLAHKTMLNELGGILASSLDADKTLGEVSRRVVQQLANLCWIELVQEDGPKALHVRARAAALSDFSPSPDCPRLAASVWSTLEPELVEISPADWEPSPEGDARRSARQQDMEAPTRALLKSMGARSLVRGPMISRGELRGFLVAVSSERSYDALDLQLVAQIAERAALALENASLHAALEQARTDLRVRAAELDEAQERVLTLAGFLPVCARCGRIRDDQRNGEWKHFDEYAADQTREGGPQGMCPECARLHVHPRAPRTYL